MRWSLEQDVITRREWLRQTAAGYAALVGGGGLAWALGGCRGARGATDAGGGGTTDGGAGSDAASPATDGGAGPGDGATARCPTPACEETDPDQLGPYYRAGAPFRTEMNVLGEPGTPLVVRGCVFGTGCAAGLAGALVDVWSANDTGAYDNTTADFQLRGRLYADADGAYEFRTLFPGYYEVAPGAFRPHHLHLIVTAPGHVSLTTQLYFAGDPLAPSGTAFDTLVVPTADDAQGGLEAFFDVVLAAS